MPAKEPNVNRIQSSACALVLVLGTTVGAYAQTQKAPQRFLIERDIPGASKMSPSDLQGAAAKSNAVLRAMGPDIQWIQTYVAGDRMYCIYQASSEALIREHATKAGFPANRVTAISTVVDPTTAAR